MARHVGETRAEGPSGGEGRAEGPSVSPWPAGGAGRRPVLWCRAGQGRAWRRGPKARPFAWRKGAGRRPVRLGLGLAESRPRGAADPVRTERLRPASAGFARPGRSGTAWLRGHAPFRVGPCRSQPHPPTRNPSGSHHRAYGGPAGALGADHPRRPRPVPRWPHVALSHIRQRECRPKQPQPPGGTSRRHVALTPRWPMLLSATSANAKPKRSHHRAYAGLAGPRSRCRPPPPAMRGSTLAHWLSATFANPSADPTAAAAGADTSPSLRDGPYRCQPHPPTRSPNGGHDRSPGYGRTAPASRRS